MIKRTLKNVRRLKWFCVSMWLYGGALMIYFAKCLADGLIDSIAWGIVGAVVLVSGWVFWLMGFVSYEEIEQEIEEKERAKK